MSGIGPSLGATPPRNTHWQWSQPLENDQRPESRKPPSTRSTFPVGAYDELIRTLRVLAPDVALRLLREEPELPVVDADDAQKPGARRARGGDLRDGLEEGQRTQLETAPSTRLKRAKKAGRFGTLQGFVGQSPQRFALCRSAADGRHELADALEVRLVVHKPPLLVDSF